MASLVRQIYMILSFRRFSIALIVVFGLTACDLPSDNSISSGGNGGSNGGNGGSGTVLNPPAPKDEYYYKELQQSPDSQIIYVSSSMGNDANSGLSESNPVRSLARGVSLLRNGFPDWLLLHMGDTWYESLGQWRLSGRSATEPMVVATYGTGNVRPILKTGASMALYIGPNGGAPASNDYLVFAGLHFYAHTRDPNSPEFVSSAGNAGVRWIRGTQGLLIEDCKIAFYTINITIHSSSLDIRNVMLRRNVIVDSYNTSGHSQGMYINDVESLLIEENILDHNGWNESVAGAEKTLFNHNMYLQYGNAAEAITVRNNIVARASSHGIQHRNGGLIQGNFWVENPINIQMGSHLNSAPFVNGSIVDNVIVNGNDIGGSSPRAWGIGMHNTNNIPVTNNILANDMSGGVPVFQQKTVYDDQSSGSTWTETGTIVHDWGSGNDTGSPGDYFDPNRTIQGYNASVGGLGTKADFYAKLRRQSAESWDENYSVDNIKLYFEVGYTPN